MKSNKITTVKSIVLNKPTAQIKTVKYNWEEDTAKIDVLFKEENAINGRIISFEIETNKNMSSTDIEQFIKQQLPDFE